MDNAYQSLIAFAQVVMIDISLAGDNAVVVGLAASRVAPDIRKQVILWGTLGAVLLRILFAAITTQLFSIIGLRLAGGILLLWVCWKMYRELRRDAEARRGLKESPENPAEALPTLGFRGAVIQIVVADLSMSLDNVLAVAGAARNHLAILVAGLALSVVLMAVVANYLARLLARHTWISWLGLAIIFYVAIEMIWRGTTEIMASVS